MAEFPRENWDLDFRAELYKEEFFASDAWARVRDRMVAPWEGSIVEELTSLRKLKKTERPRHPGEIVREQQGLVMIGAWYELLEIGPVSHPLTAELLHATIYLAGSVASCFKARFNRVRPWTLAPDLSPPVPFPGLPAYPGGHATQVYLMAHTLLYLVPDQKDRDRIMARADNIAANRERGGLNYPSDTAAAKELAAQIFDILMSECARFKSTLESAQAKEWAPGQRPGAAILRQAGFPA
jgi:hypothetical protein